MLKLHPEIVTKNGRKASVILSYREFCAIQKRLADVDDLLTLRKAKRAERKKKSVPLIEVKKKLGLV